jgi:hypothetical protein
MLAHGTSAMRSLDQSGEHGIFLAGDNCLPCLSGHLELHVHENEGSIVVENDLGGDQIVTEQPRFLARRLGGKAAEQCQ